MNTDDEEEDDIKSETEEDRTVLDKEYVEEEGPSFYRAFNMEIPDEESIQPEVEGPNGRVSHWV